MCTLRNLREEVGGIWSHQISLERLSVWVGFYLFTCVDRGVFFVETAGSNLEVRWYMFVYPTVQTPPLVILSVFRKITLFGRSDTVYYATMGEPIPKP